MKLYHYTCEDHHAPEIRESGLVVPQDQKLLGIKASWWTSVQRPPRRALALSSVTLNCDRMSALFEAQSVKGIAHWSEVRASLIRLKPEVEKYIRILEAAPGARPAYWWIAPEDVAVTEVKL